MGNSITLIDEGNELHVWVTDTIARRPKRVYLGKVDQRDQPALRAEIQKLVDDYIASKRS